MDECNESYLMAWSQADSFLCVGQWIRGAVVISALGDLLVFVVALSSACDAGSLVLGLCEEWLCT